MPDRIAAEGRVVETAPAKLNLDLLIAGRRPDGYHELDSVVVFGLVGDRLELEAAEDFSLTVRGRFAAEVPRGEANLVLRAARLLADWLGGGLGARILLEKNIPVGAGLGGGSSDAAATLRGLLRLWKLRLQMTELLDLALELGADVPVCLYGRTARVRGIGERIDPIRGLPDLPLLLVQPGCRLETGQVFRRLRADAVAGVDRTPLPAGPSLPIFAAWLAQSRNDLEAPARELAPAIGELLALLEGLPGCQLARLTGSGSVCFGLFDRPTAAEEARATVVSTRPDWWATAGVIEGCR